MADTNVQPAGAPGTPEMRQVAAAWIDRFEAIGGYFGRIYNPDGLQKSLCMGHPMPYTWEPPALHNPKLSICDCILEQSQHEGAVKMLRSFLDLVPGLRSAVYDLALEYGAVLS